MVLLLRRLRILLTITWVKSEFSAERKLVCLQIVGEIKAAREALIEVTSKLRSFAYGEFIQEETPQPPESAPSPTRSDMRKDANSGHNITSSQKTLIGNDSPQNSPDDQKSHPAKV